MINLGHGGEPCRYSAGVSAEADSDSSDSGSETDSEWDTDTTNGETDTTDFDTDAALMEGDAEAVHVENEMEGEMERTNFNPATDAGLPTNIWTDAAPPKNRRRPNDVHSHAVFPDSSAPANDTYPVITIVDVTGIHELPIHYCTCHAHPISNDSQLFDYGLFPATFKKTKTVFTFRVLDDYRMDNLESKTSAYNYYSKLRRVTNPAFPASVKV